MFSPAPDGRAGGKRSGEAYVVNGIRFDGFDATGLVEVKGPGYASLLNRNDEFRYGAPKLLRQAQNQVAAAQGTPITWHVAEEAAADAMRKLFQSENIKGI